MSVDHSQNIIEVKNVSFSYGDKEVLKNITLNVHKGDYLGIMGPNGGGKTTLVKIMLGLLKPTSGKIFLFGQDIQKFSYWSKVGYIPQKAVNFDTNFPITVKEVVNMGRIGKRGLFHSLTDSDHAIVKKSLEQVDMWDLRNKIIGDLSGGQQQRVFIAKALAGQPEVIFLDEPTIGVDIKTQEEFYGLLKKLNQELHLTLILVSHDIDVITHETTEMACINQTLIYDSNPKDFIKNDGLKKLYGAQVRLILHNH